MSGEKKVNITVLLPAGRLPLNIMEAAHSLGEKYSLRMYLTTMQNLRLTDVPEEVAQDVKDTLAACGAEFKGPGKFPIPRVCVGMDHCNLGIIDTENLSKKILVKFAGREKTKAKFKIAIAGCTIGCSGVKTTDIGIIATQNGFEIFAGGKGGPFPKIGRRVERRASEDRAIEIVETLVEFHDRKTEQKQRMYKLLSDPEFPFHEV